MAKAKSMSVGTENVGPVVSLALKNILQVEAENLRRFAPDEQAIKEMAESIRLYGLFSPLLVKPIEPAEGEMVSEHTHKLIAGHQRYKALQTIAGEDPNYEVPVHILPIQVEGDQVSSEFLNLEENIRRNELSYIDRAYAIKVLKDQGVSTDVIAKRIKKTGAWISYVLKMLTLRDSIQKKIHEGTIPFRLARVLPSISEEEQDKRITAVEAGGGASEQADAAINKRGKKKNKGRKVQEEAAGTPEKGLSAKKAVLHLTEIVGGLKEQEKVSKHDESLIALFTLTSKWLEGKLGIKAFQNKIGELV
jgi:ParB family chromosome partitioning protein